MEQIVVLKIPQQQEYDQQEKFVLPAQDTWNQLKEALLTLIAEVEAILISQPLTVELLIDGNNLNVVSLSTLLTKQNRLVMPPSEEFWRADIYCRKAGEESKNFPQSDAQDDRKNFSDNLQMLNVKERIDTRSNIDDQILEQPISKLLLLFKTSSIELKLFPR